MARLFEENWGHVFALCVAIFGLFIFGQLLFQGSYTAESLLENVDSPQALRDHSREFDVPEVIQVTEGIYMAVGFGIANSILVEAPEGAIIIDTMESVEAGRDVIAAFRKVTTSPIKAIIYTHCHHDHLNGASAFVEENSEPPEIWAYHSLLKQLEMISFKTSALYTGQARQFGSLLPRNAHINSGIGPKLRLGSFGYIPPTRLVFKEREDVTIAGLKLTMIHIPGETSDQMGVWYAEKKAFMCADDLYRSFPNIYAIRGTPIRNALEWIESIDKIRNLKPKFIVPGHTRFIEGETFIAGVLRDYRDAIQYIHDQTVRYMNKGYYPEDIIPMIELPEKLASNPWLKEFYGTVEWSVKSVFSQYLGWFTGNVADLKSMPSKERAANMIEFGGGAKAVCNTAKASLKTGDYQWALELATHVLTINPNDAACKEVRLGALRSLASKHTSASGRNYYLTVALEDYDLLSTKLPQHIRVRAIQKLSTRELFNVMRTKLIAENCIDIQTTAVFNFTDIREVYTLNIRQGILDVLAEPSSEWDVKVTVTWQTWKDIAVSVRSPLSAYIAGDLQIAGGITALKSFMGNFERE